MFTRATLTPSQTYAMEVARVAFMAACPFYAYYFYAEMKEYPTEDIPTAATDGRRIYYNPEYLEKLSVQERAFVLAHEVMHQIKRDPQRMKAYMTAGKVKSVPADRDFMNVCQDYVINRLLVDAEIGKINPDWLYDADVGADEFWEDVYEARYKEPPPQDGQGKGGKGKGNDQGQGPGKGKGQAPGKKAGTAPGVTGKGQKGDPNATDGRFDAVMEPAVDPVTGEEDVPSESEFKEAVARAAAAAKAMGKMPAGLQSLVDGILTPQVDWREHLRLTAMNYIGNNAENWNRPNRRRLALNPIVIMPGRRGFGAELVVVVVDTSGSIGGRELQVFLSEVSGIIADGHPKEVMLISCDAAIQQVDFARTLDELEVVRAKGLKGGGGTSFIPPFEHLAKENLKPDALIYLTDMMGSFPDKDPGFPVIWCATTDAKGPFGQTIKINLTT